MSLLVIRCIGDDTHHVTPQCGIALPHYAMYGSDMTVPTWTVEDLRALDGDELLTAVDEFIATAKADIKEARLLRDAVVARWVDQLGPAKTARRAHLSVSSVRVIQKAAQR